MNKDHRDNHGDDCIKEAVKMEMDSHPQPDTERLWQRIDSNIELVKSLNETPTKKQHSRLWLKIATVLVVLVLCAAFAGVTTQVGETLPFGWVFQELRQYVTGEQTLVHFRLGEETAPAQPKNPPPPPPPPEFDVAEVEAPQTNLTDTTLENLLSIYPGVLYYPQDLSSDALKTTQYLQLGDTWNIMMDYSVDGYDILFIQRDIMGKGSMGMGFGADTEISFHRLDGVEYIVTEHRYGIVGVKWNKEQKLFELTSNLPVEDALEMARSVAPYTD